MSDSGRVKNVGENVEEDFIEISSQSAGCGNEHPFWDFNLCGFLKSKFVIFFFLLCISIMVSTIVLSFVCLGANDPDGGIAKVNSFTSLQLHVSLSSWPSSQSSPFGFLIKEDLVSKEEEERTDEVEGSTVKKSTQVLFLWHFTSAAVCFSLFIVVVCALLLIYFEIIYSDKCYCYAWLILLIIPLAIIPAVRMDGFSTASYWLFFIPYLLLALVLPVLFCYYVSTEVEFDYKHTRSLVTGTAPVSYVLLLAGLVLWILRLDSVLPPSFKYTFIFIFIAVGFFCGFFPAADGLLRSFLEIMFYTVDEIDEIHNYKFEYPCGCDSAFSLLVYNGVYIVFTLVLYGGCFLPFTLRKDLVFHTSYHFTLIPHHIINIIGFLLLIFLIRRRRIDNVVILTILSVVAAAFLALSLVCLGGANDACEKKYADGRGKMLTMEPVVASAFSLQSWQVSSVFPSSSQSSQSSSFVVPTSNGKDGRDIVSREDGNRNGTGPRKK